MGDWLEGNKMRTQSALQAQQMANQTRQQGFENLMTGVESTNRAMAPFVKQKLDLDTEEKLYGPDGIRTGYETGQKELQAKIASEANIKSFQAAYPGEEAFEWVGEGPNRTKKPSRAYMMYTFGFDPSLQWGRYELDRDKQYGQMTDVLRSSFNYIRDQMGPSIVVDPETGKLQGLDGERKEAFIDHIAQSLWNNNNKGRWGIKTWEQAKRKAAEWVDGAVWTGMDKAGADVQMLSKTGEKVQKFKINANDYERGPSNTGDYREIQYGPILRKKIASVNTMINQATNYVKDDKILNSILSHGTNLKKWLHGAKSETQRTNLIEEAATRITNKYLQYMKTLEDEDKDENFIQQLNDTYTLLKSGDWLDSGSQGTYKSQNLPTVNNVFSFQSLAQ